MSDDDHDNDDEDRFSVFTNKYAKFEETYMKKNTFGTRWIGRK